MCSVFSVSVCPDVSSIYLSVDVVLLHTIYRRIKSSQRLLFEGNQSNNVSTTPMLLLIPYTNGVPNVVLSTSTYSWRGSLKCKTLSQKAGHSLHTLFRWYISMSLCRSSVIHTSSWVSATGLH